MIMKRVAAVTFLAAAAACGGDAANEPAEAPPAATSAPAAPTLGEMTMPAWFTVSNEGQAVSMDIIAGETDAKNYWNYNGATDGNMTITVPQGAVVTINFSNQDPNMAHSLGISELMTSPTAAPAPTPVFEGAITSNPTSMVEATLNGQSETITFTADSAGEYAVLCYVPGHAATGMWIRFNVSADGEAGVQTTM